MLGSRFDMARFLRDTHGDDRIEPAKGGSAEADCREMEREIIEMARLIHSARTRVTFRCPVCDDVMSLGGEQRLSEFGKLDVKLHRLECGTCGMLTGRVFHPSIGYDPRMIR